MASITIRDLDDRTKERLRVRAARNGRSMEEEARTILRATVSEPSADSSSLAETIGRLFRPLGGVVLRIPKREPTREPPEPG